jgi:hypothetical protein
MNRNGMDSLRCHLQLSGPANMTCAYVHLGLHGHPVKVGEDQEIKERTHKLIEE